METEAKPKARNFFRRWVLATFAGWLLGVVVVLILAEAGEIIGWVQSPVGIGMGLSIGYMQWRIARIWFTCTSEWMWGSVAGMGFPFVLSDIVGVLWRDTPAFIGDEYLTLLINVALGGLLAGLWQRRTLQAHSVRANWWVAASLACWMFAAAATILLIVPGHPETSLELWRNFGAIGIGGIVLGLLSGRALLWLLRP